MDKEYKVKKINNDRFELITLNTDTDENTISSFRKDTVLDIYGALQNNITKMKQNISQQTKELSGYEDAERELGEKYTNLDLDRHLELSKLATARTNLANTQQQIDATKALIEQMESQIKQIEAAIPELKRN